MVTVVSEATKAHLVQVVKVNPDKIRVISNFVSPQFKPTLKPFNEIPVVLLIGTAHNKNLQRCIHALKDIKCKIVLVGYPENELLKLLDSQANEFKVLNDLSENELIKCYNTCDFLLFASILEGFGLPIIEAQATGRPVITANLSSMPEVAGDGACLVDPYSVESIRTGILKVINNSEYRNSLIEKGFENVKRYSLEKVASQYAALYEEVYANQKK